MLYTNQAKLEAYLNRALTANELVNLTSQITAVSAQIAAYLNRNYLDVGVTTTAGVTNTVRYYDGTGSHALFLDDYISIASIELLDSFGDTYETISDADAFINYPLNGTIFDNAYLREFRAPGYEQRVKVTGKFTSGVVPEEVVMLATAMMANNIQFQSTAIGDFESESIEGYSYKLKTTGSIDKGNSISQFSAVDHLRKITF